MRTFGFLWQRTPDLRFTATSGCTPCRNKTVGNDLRHLFAGRPFHGLKVYRHGYGTVDGHHNAVRSKFQWHRIAGQAIKQLIVDGLLVHRQRIDEPSPCRLLDRALQHQARLRREALDRVGNGVAASLDLVEGIVADLFPQIREQFVAGLVVVLMHAWNPDFVQQHYPHFVARWVSEGPDGSAWVKPAPTLAPGAADRSTAYDFGWAAVCASEVGDEALLKRLHAYADARLDPTWQHGGLYYPRCDQRLDEEGLLRAMDPHTGNALLPYSRLNVPGGLRALYEGPWQDEHFVQPALAAMTPSLDVRRACFDPQINALALTLGPARDTKARPETRLELANVWHRGAWRLERDQELLAYGDAERVLWTSPNVRVERAHDQMIVELDLIDTTTMVLSWN